MDEPQIAVTTFESIIHLIDVIIWPTILLVILFLFRGNFKEAMKRLGSFNASTSGITMTFDKQLEVAKNIMKGLTSSISKDNDLNDELDLPIHEFKELQNKLDAKIHQIAIDKKIDTTTLSSQDLVAKFKEVGLFTIQQYDLIKAFKNLGKIATPQLTKKQLNELKSIYDNIKL